jgi:hypothetical protein
MAFCKVGILPKLLKVSFSSNEPSIPRTVVFDNPEEVVKFVMCLMFFV